LPCQPLLISYFFVGSSFESRLGVKVSGRRFTLPYSVPRISLTMSRTLLSLSYPILQRSAWLLHLLLCWVALSIDILGTEPVCCKQLISKTKCLHQLKMRKPALCTTSYCNGYTSMKYKTAIFKFSADINYIIINLLSLLAKLYRRNLLTDITFVPKTSY